MRIVSVVLLALIAGCTQPRSARCKEVCTREAECTDEKSGESAFDESDCVAACAALERDKETRGLVEKHADCIANAKGSCPAIIECK